MLLSILDGLVCTYIHWYVPKALRHLHASKINALNVYATYDVPGSSGPKKNRVYLGIAQIAIAQIRALSGTIFWPKFRKFFKHQF